MQQPPQVISQFEERRKTCLQRRQRFEDQDFPASDSSVFCSRESPQQFEWLRPDEICSLLGAPPPELISEQPQRFDVSQGQYGDCWVVAAMAAMSENEQLLQRVVPRGQSFAPQWYAGMFLFRFWRFGQWQEVYVDDRLPTIRGRPAFIHSTSCVEFWPALLEKAFAKLYGSYEALKSGLLADSLSDLTGGLVESYQVRGPNKNLPENIVNVMFKALERESLIGCAISGGGRRLQNGLVPGHQYTVTDLREIRLITNTGELPFTLIRLRNPWGDHVEWNGAWSDRSEEWSSIPAPDKQEMGLVFRADGEFWMELRDFLANFDTLTICNLTPDAPLKTPRRWTAKVFHGSWLPGHSAGGRPECRDSHWSNPQYRVTLREPDDDEPGLCSVIVELMQKDRRTVHYKAPTYANIGFIIYRVQPHHGEGPLQKGFFDAETPIGSVEYFANIRQICSRFLLPPGQYVVVPSTYEPNVFASYVLRLFFEKPSAVAGQAEVETTAAPHTVPLDPLQRELDDKFRQMFYEASGEEMQVDVFELRRFLSSAGGGETSLPTARALLLLTDADLTGRLNYTEFVRLLQLVNAWRRVYLEMSRPDEPLRSAKLGGLLRRLGYSLPTRLLRAISLNAADERGHVPLDHVTRVLARLQRLTGTWQRLQQAGRAPLSLEQWLDEAF